MGCDPAPTCRAALGELNHMFPGRKTDSDGICASATHHGQNPHSDHETGDAFDATHDPAHGFDSYKAADWLRARVLNGNETRVKYIISNRRIFNPSVSSVWRYYGGSNPHDHHVHVSLRGGPYSPVSVRNDLHLWWSGFGNPHEEAEMDATERKMLVAAAEDAQAARVAAEKAQAAATEIVAVGGTHSLNEILTKMFDQDKANGEMLAQLTKEFRDYVVTHP